MLRRELKIFACVWISEFSLDKKKKNFELNNLYFKTQVLNLGQGSICFPIGSFFISFFSEGGGSALFNLKFFNDSYDPDFFFFNAKFVRF